MDPIDFYTSMRQYADHLLPIWWELTEAERGTWWGTGPVVARLRGLGVNAQVGQGRGAGLVVVAAQSDYATTGRRPVVYVEHGAGQTYPADPRARGNGAYSGGARRDRTVLFIVPSERVAAANRAAYPHIPNAVVGSPRLDQWCNIFGRTSTADVAGDIPTKGFRANVTPGYHLGANALVRASSEVAKPEQTVALSFHWECRICDEARNAWPHYDAELPALVTAARARGVRLLGHGHPRIWPRLADRWRALGVELAPEFDQVLAEADLYVCDNSSTLYEFAATGRPVLVLNAPWYRRDVEHGLRFWQHADVGLQVDDAEQLVPMTWLALSDPAPVRAMRAEHASAVYPHADGHAAERAADAIRRLAGTDRKATPMGQVTHPFNGSRPTRYANEMGASFPADRLAGLGATDAELVAAREAWQALTPDQQAQTAAMLAEQSDDDLLAMMEQDRMENADEAEQALYAWAETEVAAGTYADVNAALDALDQWADALDAAGRDPEPLVGVPTPPEVPEDEPTVADPDAPTPADDSGVIGEQREAPADGLPEAGAEPAPDGYPEGGSVGDVLNWVAEDGALTLIRARHAIAAEGWREGGPRKTVTEPLTKIVGSGT